MQKDLFIEEQRGDNNKPVDVSTIGIYFGDSNHNRQLLSRTSAYINSIPKGKYMIYPTGSTHRLPIYEGRDDFPYVINAWTNRTITVGFSRDKYPTVDIISKDMKKTIYIHRLVAMAFLPNPLPLDRTIAHHINDDKYDYAVSNLEWVTPSYNISQQNVAPKNVVKYIKNVEHVHE
jgi:hypothetical protein